MILLLFLIITIGLSPSQAQDDVVDSSPSTKPDGEAKTDPEFCAHLQEKCAACKNGSLMGGTYTGFITYLACSPAGQLVNCSVIESYIKYSNVNTDEIYITCTWPSKKGAQQMAEYSKELKKSWKKRPGKHGKRAKINETEVVEDPDEIKDKPQHGKVPDTKGKRLHAIWANATGPDATGPDAKGPDAKGPDAKGPDAKGPDAKGPDAKSPSTKGSHANGPASKGPDAKGPNAKGAGAKKIGGKNSADAKGPAAGGKAKGPKA